MKCYIMLLLCSKLISKYKLLSSNRRTQKDNQKDNQKNKLSHDNKRSAFSIYSPIVSEKNIESRQMEKYNTKRRKIKEVSYDSEEEMVTHTQENNYEYEGESDEENSYSDTCVVSNDNNIEKLELLGDNIKSVLNNVTLFPDGYKYTEQCIEDIIEKIIPKQIFKVSQILNNNENISREIHTGFIDSIVYKFNLNNLKRPSMVAKICELFKKKDSENDIVSGTPKTMYISPSEQNDVQQKYMGNQDNHVQTGPKMIMPEKFNQNNHENLEDHMEINRENNSLHEMVKYTPEELSAMNKSNKSLDYSDNKSQGPIYENDSNFDQEELKRIIMTSLEGPESLPEQQQKENHDISEDFFNDNIPNIIQCSTHYEFMYVTDIEKENQKDYVINKPFIKKYMLSKVRYMLSKFYKENHLKEQIANDIVSNAYLCFNNLLNHPPFTVDNVNEILQDSVQYVIKQMLKHNEYNLEPKSQNEINNFKDQDYRDEKIEEEERQNRINGEFDEDMTDDKQQMILFKERLKELFNITS